MVNTFARFEVTPFSSRSDYERVVDYFLDADEAFLRAMGVDRNKLPDRELWLNRLLPDLTRPDAQKQTFYVGWDYEGTRMGHCNMNPLRYGDQAHLHLHIWEHSARRAGLGTEFLRRSAQMFIQRFALQRLYCEPYAANPAPNRALAKAGFRLVKRYRTTPGPINFEQQVNQYVIDQQTSTHPGLFLHRQSAENHG